jgi:hypothetical protein
MSHYLHIKKSEAKSNRGDLVIHLTESEKVIGAAVETNKDGQHTLVAVVEASDAD